jgi:hypothetical protein
VYGFGTAILAVLSAKLGGVALAVILMAILVVFGVIAAFKISFYLPAKAVDAGITLRQSWNMTTGYAWKMFVAGFLSSWRILLITLAYALMAGALGGMLGGTLFGVESLGFRFVMFICLLPLIVYAQPLMTVIGVTVLSNYYQWAINNPRNVS